VPSAVGRLALPAAPAVDAALDAALAATEVLIVPIELPGWSDATRAGARLLAAEAWAVDGHLVGTGKVGADVVARLEGGARTTRDELDAASNVAERWRTELAELFKRVEVVALPTLLDVPPLLEEAEKMMNVRATIPVNLAGVPAVSIPVPADPLPASLQLVGPPGSEERLVALARRVEAALAH
jgi:amidase